MLFQNLPPSTNLIEIRELKKEEDDFITKLIHLNKYAIMVINKPSTYLNEETIVLQKALLESEEIYLDEGDVFIGINKPKYINGILYSENKDGANLKNLVHLRRLIIKMTKLYLSLPNYKTSEEWWACRRKVVELTEFP